MSCARQRLHIGAPGLGERGTTVRLRVRIDRRHRPRRQPLSRASDGRPCRSPPPTSASADALGRASSRLPQALQRRRARIAARRLAGDRDAGCRGQRSCTPSALLDAHQVRSWSPNSSASSGCRRTRAARPCVRTRGGVGIAAAGSQRSALAREAVRTRRWRSAAAISTRYLADQCASVSTWTDCSHGDLPISWPGWRPGRSNSTGRVRPTVAALKARACSAEQRLQPLRAARPSPSRAPDRRMPAAGRAGPAAEYLKRVGLRRSRPRSTSAGSPRNRRRSRRESRR